MGHSQECDEQSDDRAPYSDTASKQKNFGFQPVMVHVKEIRRDDGPVATTQPTQGGRARNAEHGDDFRVTCGSHECPKTTHSGLSHELADEIPDRWLSSKNAEVPLAQNIRVQLQQTPQARLELIFENQRVTCLALPKRPQPIPYPIEAATAPFGAT